MSYEKFFNGYLESDLPQKLDQSKDERLSFLVEADICCDEKMHSYFKDFPVPAQKYKISNAALSQKSKVYKNEQNYGKNMNEEAQPSVSSPSKLCLTLLPKFRFKSTLENLLLLTEIGYEVTKVHSVLRSVSSAFLAGWVLHNTQMRDKAKQAGNIYLDMFYKLVASIMFHRAGSLLKMT